MHSNLLTIQSVIPAIIGAVSAITVALLAAWLGYRRYIRERSHEHETRLNTLFGELANIYEHYVYAAYELPRVPADHHEVQLRLQLSLYGELHSIKDISKLGFLSANDIRLLIQLGIRIRNNDIWFKWLSEAADVKADNLAFAKMRMEYAASTAHDILHRLVDERPNLKIILRKLEEGIPHILKPTTSIN